MDNSLISRQAAIDTATEYEKQLREILGDKNELAETVKILKHRIVALQPAEPERKTGKWIKLDMHHKCTACGQECYVPTCMGEPMYTYCPNCGARMEGVNETD